MQPVQHNQPDDLQPLDPGRLPEHPLVSVLMSNYNYGRYIGQAIESVLGQTYPRLELIVCDDGSTDDSMAIVRRYLKDSRVQLLNKENGGHATGLNAAFGVAQGDIVCFLDSDDLFELSKLEVLVERMKRDEDSACVLHASVRTDHILRPKGRTPLLVSLPSGWRGREVLRAGGLLAYMPGTAGLNLRRKLADVLFPLPTTRPLNAFPDMVVARLAPLFSRLASINEPLAKVRLHSSNTYQRFRITAEWLRRELEISQHLWDLQHHRLEGIRPSLGSALAPLDSAHVVLLEQYIAARLERKDDWGAYARRFFAHLATHDRPLWELAFWKGTSLLPLPWFDTAVNMALGPSRTKQLVSKLKIFAQFRISRDRAREYAG